MEDLETYRAICANRIRRLERYRKARSFCSLEDTEDPTTLSTSTSIIVEDGNENKNESSSTFDQIREKMFSLMENDMTLLQQLLTLGDQINEIKKDRLRKTMSQNSITEYYDEEEHEKEDKFDVDSASGFSASMSAVTHLYVDDDQPQFFSRQNSVLRIPIPPRSSNRFGPRRVIRRPSDVLSRTQLINIGNGRQLHVNSDDGSSELSDTSSSESTSKTHSPTNSLSNASTMTLPQKTKKNRSSNSSIDSGIRDEHLTPSPTFESVVI